jgi:hypothetical protein
MIEGSLEKMTLAMQSGAGFEKRRKPARRDEFLDRTRICQ